MYTNEKKFKFRGRGNKPHPLSQQNPVQLLNIANITRNGMLKPLD